MTTTLSRLECNDLLDHHAQRYIKIHQHNTSIYVADVYEGETLLYCIATDYDEKSIREKVREWNRSKGLKVV